MTQQGHELATRRNKIDDSHSRISRVTLDLADLRHSVEQKMQAYKLKRKSTDLSIPTSSSTGSAQKELYEAMFDFTARHPDELSFTTGTLIDVFANAPINVGPETYVRKKVDGKIDPFDPFGVHKIMTNTFVPGGGIMTTATTIGTTTASTTIIPLNATTAKSTNSFTEPLDDLVKSESATKLGDTITDNDNNEFYGKVQQDWDISMSTISLPENITSDQLLTLKIEDNVKIIKENYNKEWLFGEITDKFGSVIRGWFPANCLKPFTKPSSLDFKTGPNMSSSPSYSSKQPNNILFSCIALYPYESNVPGDLNLSVGDLIRVYVIKDDWWEGVCERTQLKGLFPANYVRKLSIEESRSMEEKLRIGGSISDQIVNSPSQPKIIPVSSLKLMEANPDNNCTTSLLSSSNVSSSSSSGGVVVCTQPEFARVIAPYKATSTGQLTLQPGQVVQLRKRSPKGWWEGELQQRGHIRQIGWFPADFVRLITPLTVNGSSNSSDQQLLSKSTSSTNNQTKNYTPTSLKALASKAITIPNDADSSIHDSQQTQSNRVEMMQTIFSYKAVHADELTFEEGAIITVLGRDEPEWWRGRLQSSGAEGLFPVNYVRPYIPTQKGKASNSVIPAQISSDISRNLRERDFAIKELIETELAYGKSLIEVQDVFYKPLKASKMLTVQQLDDIFPHWNELIDTSTEFYHDLNDCLEANPSVQLVGQILLKHMGKFKVYRHYCIRQRVACETLQHCLSTNYRLNQIIKIFEKNTKTKGLPLSSYLLKPMQRITKYKLIVGKIALNTDLSLPNHGEFVKAYDLICALLKSIDHAIGFEDSYNRIEWFRSRLIGADKWLLDWLSNSTTQHRHDKPHLVHCGTLYKAKNNREFVCFLFNKYLILTTPNYTTSGQLFEFPPINDPNAMKWSFTLYKEPLALNQIYVFKGSFKQNSESITPPPHSTPYDKSMSNEIVRCVSTCTLSDSVDNSTSNNRRLSEIVKYSTTNVFSLLKRRNSWQPIVTLKAPSNELCDLWVSILRENTKTDITSFGSHPPHSPSLKSECPQHLMFTVLNVSTNSQESKTSETLNFIMPESSEKSLHITAFKSLPFINSNMIGSCIMPFSSIFTHFPPISLESFTKQIELDQSIGMKMEFSDPEIIKRLNLAPEIREDYAELFQITLWTSIALILIVWGVSWGIWNMDPGRDGIIYRGTMTRPKQD
ncbi:hypothetical protein MN116_001826 [Schistosoma mekongi]|uniref:Dynamin-associated protein n=1 Tax=Schistosoma mekongi TaxID=38744 RepID=A0AAE2D7T6_SCHME|nr:hypothetical protein MN116_001826 [Schistosoma mekongi]